MAGRARILGASTKVDPRPYSLRQTARPGASPAVKGLTDGQYGTTRLRRIGKGLMARIRSVSPELRTSESAAAWSRECRYAWVLLWGYLDDYGRGLDNARVIAADCFPLDDDVTPALMTEWLDTWEKAASICRYQEGEKRFLHALNWREYQKPQHPGKVRTPPCREHEPAAFSAWSVAHEAEIGQSSGQSHEDLMSVSPTRGRGSREREGEEELRRRGRGSAAKPRCPKHLNHPNPPNCGPCKDARLDHERRNAEPKPALSVVPPNLLCPEHGSELAGACSRCAAARRGA